MLILDTNVLRDAGLVRRLRTRYPASRLGAPAVVVMELLHQVIRGIEDSRRALAPIAQGEVEVLPEFGEVLRACFTQPPVLHQDHPAAWQRLARLVVNDHAERRVIRREWDQLAQRSEIGYSATRFMEIKTETSFRDGLNALFSRNRETGKSIESSRPDDVTKSQAAWVAVLVQHYCLVSTGMVRCWLLNQLAAGAGVSGAARSDAEKPPAEDLFGLYEGQVRAAYRGGLETLVSVFESRTLPWILQAQGKQPEENDFWDCMILASVGDGPDDVLVTREADWVSAADRAGLGSKVLLPEALLGPLTQPRGMPPTVDGSVVAGAIDWVAESRDARVRVLQKRWLSPWAVKGWLGDARLDAATAYEASPATWWPAEGTAGDEQVVTWASAFALRCADALALITPGKLTFTARELLDGSCSASRRLLEHRWLPRGHTHEPFRLLNELTVSAYELEGNPTLLTVEVEPSLTCHAGVAVDEETPLRGIGRDGLGAVLHRLLLVQSPVRFLLARVGAVDGASDQSQVLTTQKHLSALMSRYGGALLGDTHLCAILIPELKNLDLSGVHIGIWNRRDFAWSQARSRSPADAEAGQPSNGSPRTGATQ